MRIFCELDTTYDNPRYLPEYDEIVDWMVDTKDKGLLLMGDCGRGKSIIITGVIPVLLKLSGRNVKPIMAHELNRTVCYDSYFTNPPEVTYLDYATSQFAGISLVDGSVPKPCTTTTESVSVRSISGLGRAVSPQAVPLHQPHRAGNPRPLRCAPLT